MTCVNRLRSFTLAIVCVAVGVGSASARELAPSRDERFTIGTSGSVCDAQGVKLGAARQSIFDRKWIILCRDIAQPVGAAYVLRGGEDAAARIVAARENPLTCEDDSAAPLSEGITVRANDCRASASGLQWRSYRYATGKALYVVEGLSGYDSALRLALRNIIEDRIVPGEISVVSTGAGGGALSLAKRNALDLPTLIGQGYRRNNAGAYIEAAELFVPPDEDGEGAASRGRTDEPARFHEMTINRALQLSNLGEFTQARRLFAEAATMQVRDPVQSRLSRNYRAIDALNQNDFEGVLGILDEPVAPLAAALAEGESGPRIDRATATGLNSAPTGQLAGVVGLEVGLTVPERVTIIDAQAEQVRGTVYRLSGRLDEAQDTFTKAMASAGSVRNGRILSTVRLNAQLLSELALTYEAKGQISSGEGLLRDALGLVEAQYPDSASVNNARARLAGYLARHGQRDEAGSIFRTIVQNVAGDRRALVGMANLIQPYFDLLVEALPARPELVSDLFLASQLVERPGAADSMEQLSRRLAGGDAAASELFRQSQEISRELERTRILLARQATVVQAGGSGVGLAELGERQQRLLDMQLKVMNALAEFPQYRAVSNRVVKLDELKTLLKPGEAYLKLVQVGGAIYALYVSPDAAHGWRASMSAAEIADLVDVLRSTISLTVSGTQYTYPFDVDSSRALYDALLGPVAAEIAPVRHLIFEPDGAMLKLPINLLTGDDAGVAAYHRRVEQRIEDEYDFTGIKWLGRTTAVSTALSVTTFRDARRAPMSQAGRTYLGLGENVPLGPVAELPSVRGAVGSSVEPGCDWPVAVWNRPISGRELRDASAIFGAGQSELLVDGSFTDTAIIDRSDLDSYRIVHFATHGLVTPPREGCPARPALLTSFGNDGSDGLLGFSEIFDLRLDADLVILSACDTAAQASVEATREAGVSTGGGQALDGLVRAFIAAGSRQVIASHWPAPDDYGATRRLFSGFFRDKGDSIGGALLHAQTALMDDPQTSHPFYWSGFAIVGDGSRTLRGR